MEIYLEISEKRIFACALEWPGWARSGREEGSALKALLEYGPRYQRALGGSGLGFRAPGEVSAFAVVERVKGNATTDFGAPDVAPSSDARPLSEEESQRLQAIVEACWGTFEAAARAAAGKELRKGPRGGGRELEGVVQHVLGGEASYLARLGWKFKKGPGEDPDTQLRRIRQASLEALAAGALGELPERGPRGGVLWKPRTYVRRSAWHVLDHAWELEDRVL